MIYETYCCAKPGGVIEYGYCFKEAADVDDVLFDLVLGEVGEEAAGEHSQQQLAAYEWAAEAVCDAALEQP